MSELRQDVASDGTTVLKSHLLEHAEFPHAFSTRLGPDGTDFDLSRPGFSKLRTPAKVSEKLLVRFSEIIAPQEARFLRIPRQVHGCGVVDAEEADETEADAVISNHRRSIAAVRTADCVGILLACPKTGVVAAVHAGWRGLLANAPGAAISAILRQTKTAPSSLLAAIGPAIGAEKFEVGDEVAEAFQAADLGSAVISKGILGPRHHVNLHSAALSRLQMAGMDPGFIDGDPLCTSSDDRFFSYRREGPNSGRLLAGIASKSLRSA